VVDKASTALAERRSTPLAAQAEPGNMTPMQMAYALIQNGADLGSVKEMLAMSKELAADQAKRAYTEAFAAFKSEAITVIRGKKVTDGPLKGKSYAELYSFVDAVTPALSKHGLSASWAITRDEKDWIEVTCTIEHILGHAKTVSMGGPPDTGGAKNPIQARASTVTYLERHTLKAATGIAEQGDDKDGNADRRDDVPITTEQRDRILQLINECDMPVEKFCEWAKVDGVADLLARHYDKAVSVLQQRKEKAA
jgi:3-methyladenine DNA glycosylase AlkD